jgi:hypothetical protein
MISKVRTYFQNIIASIDSDFKEWSSPFDTEDIPETIADKLYFIKYDVTSIEEGNTHIDNNIDVTIQFFFKTFNDRIGKYDSSMDLVNSVMLDSVNIHNIEAFKAAYDNPIYRVIASSITADSIDTNDNQLIITLELNCGILQSKC